MFGMSLEKLVLVTLIAALLIGPTRLPDYARRLASFTRSMRGRMDAATARLEQDTGLTREHWNPEEWRRYDPREIILGALRDTPHEISAGASAGDATARPVSDPESGTAAPASDAMPRADERPDALSSPETLARIRPGQRVVVIGSSAHPTRVVLADLPENHPARLAARARTEQTHSAEGAATLADESATEASFGADNATPRAGVPAEVG